MFARGRTITKTPTAAAATVRTTGSSNKYEPRGIVTAAAIEASDTYRVEKKSSAQTIAAMRVTWGMRTRNPPAPVATLFPPFSLVKHEKLCPSIAAARPATQYASRWPGGKARSGQPDATAPLTASRSEEHTSELQ